MALPTTGPISFLMIRNDIDAAYPNTPMMNQQVKLVGQHLFFAEGTGAAEVYYNASGWYLQRTSGTTSISELRGKEPQYFNKAVQTFMSGYWDDDILIPEGTNMELTISEEDYLELYEDGLVDVPPVEFFARLTSRPDESIEAEGKKGPVISGFEVNSIVERTVDYHTTEGMFEITVKGHDVPVDWITSVEFINANTGETFETLVPKRPGERITAASGKIYTLWTWSCKRGQMFPEDVPVTVKLETKEMSNDESVE